MNKILIKKRASVSTNLCAACGACAKTCPRKAIDVFRGMYAKIDTNKCTGCGRCVKTCPGSIVSLTNVEIDNE